MSLINEMVMAIAKGFKPAVVTKASDEMVAGEYTVNQLIRVQGKVTKGKDYDQVIWQTVKPMKILAVALSKQNKVTADYILKLAEESLTVKDDDLMLVEATKYVNEAMAKFKKENGTETCAGKVTTKVTFSVVGAVQEKVREEIEVAEMASDLLP